MQQTHAEKDFLKKQNNKTREHPPLPILMQLITASIEKHRSTYVKTEELASYSSE